MNRCSHVVGTICILRSGNNFFYLTAYCSIRWIFRNILESNLILIWNVVWLIWINFSDLVHTVIYIYHIFLRIKTNLLICSFNAFQNVILSVKFRFFWHCSRKDLFSEYTDITYNRCCCIFCYNAIGIFIEVMDLIMKISSYSKVCNECLIFQVFRISQLIITIEECQIILLPFFKSVAVFWCYSRWLGWMLRYRPANICDLTSFTVSEDFINSSNLSGYSCYCSLIFIC